MTETPPEPMQNAILAALGTGMVSAFGAVGWYRAVITQLRSDVDALKANKETLTAIVSSHATEIALLKQGMARQELTLGRIETNIDNLPLALERAMNKPGH